MIKFEVKIGGNWVEVDNGTILLSGRALRWTYKGSRGLAGLGEWRFSERTKQDPAFKGACWDALSDEDKVLALTRQAGI